ncbi:MAG: sigma 54-interacting transcriptional regulator [Acidobacteriota bacterium]
MSELPAAFRQPSESRRPRLVVLAGPREGESFTLASEPLSVGRHPNNSLQLNQATVSRWHCVIEPTPAGFLLRDLESTGGSFVNGTAVRERRLVPGDYLKVGETLLLFLHGEDQDETYGGEEAFAAESGAQTRLGVDSTFELPVEQVLRRMLPARLETALSSSDRASRHLGLLVQAATEFQTFDRVGQLLQRLTDIALEGVPAERCLLLSSGDRWSVIAAAFSSESPGGVEALKKRPISSSVCRLVQERQVAVLSNDVESDLPSSASLASLEVSSLLCVPLESATDEQLLIYADSRSRRSPFDPEHLELLTAVSGIASMAYRVLRRSEWLEAENRRFREAQLEHDMVGESAAMEAVLKLVERVAPTDLTVLITGESGTGKELIAKALHANGPRRERPFVAVNCATLSETLLESELFGHERGAFTGAVGRKLGQFELAHEGTLFLDEVAEIPVALQAKLLRALESREIRRVGGDRPRTIDVRLVAATNRDLATAVAEGSFRRDLFHRLDVFSLALPPLRERRSDIPLLAHHFASRSAQRLHRPVSGLTAAAQAALEAYDWPGNVRELRNAIERAVVLAADEFLRPEDLPELLLEWAPAPADHSAGYHQAVRRAKREILRAALEEAGGSYKEAAERLSLNRTYLHRLITNLGLRLEEPGS